jgi:hypothetical protein
MNVQCTTAAFTLSPVPGGLRHLVLTRPETEPSMRFLSVGSHLCARASFRQALADLPLPSASSYSRPHRGHHRYSYRGLSPHQFMPMSGVHPSVQRTASPPLTFAVCAGHGALLRRCKSYGQVFAEPKARRRARASPRGGVWRKSNPKLRGDEQKPDRRRGVSGASGHVTAKPSVCDRDALCKSGAYAVKVTSLTPGDLPGASGTRRSWALSDRRRLPCGEVSRGHSRRVAPPKARTMNDEAEQ